MSASYKQISVNGTDVVLEDDQATKSLLSLLRDDLALTGTKEGCASGDCGACTVVVRDDERGIHTVNSCITPVGAVLGAQVLTVEGAGQPDAPHPVQQAMVDCHGSQCGFCTPGFVMSLVAQQLQSDASNRSIDGPSRDEVLTAISGNLCRCTGYRPIIDAAYANQNLKNIQDPARNLLQSAQVAAQDDERGALKTSSSYLRPLNLAALATALSELQDDDHSVILAGATDAWLNWSQNYIDYTRILDLSGVEEMRGIDLHEGEFSVGAAVTHAMLEDYFSKVHPRQAIVHVLHHFGSPQVRARGTIGGNVANGSPIADWPPLLLAMDAHVTLMNSAGETRVLELSQFYRGYRDTALEDNEVVVKLGFADVADADLYAHKISKRTEDDISSVLLASRLTLDAGCLTQVRVALGGVAATPVRVEPLERALLGVNLAASSDEQLRSYCDLLDDCIAPITDVRATAAYRLQMAKNLLLQALLEKAGRAGAAQLGSSINLRQLRAYNQTMAAQVGKPEKTEPEETELEKTESEKTSSGAQGASHAHESAMAHVTGTARYIDDIPLPQDALHVATAFVPHAVGSLLPFAPDAQALLLKAPGVVDVITRQDVPGDNDIGPVFEGDKLLAEEAIPFYGQPVIAIAARSFRQAQQAAVQARQYPTINDSTGVNNFSAKEVALDEPSSKPEAQEEGIFTLDAAIARDTKVLPGRVWGKRDVVVSGEHRIAGVQDIGGQEHFYLEGQAAIAYPQDDGGVLVCASTQHPDDMQHLVAKVLGLPLHLVTVQCLRMGGGFGGKETQAAPVACLAALFAQRTGKVVKYRLPRKDDMVQTGKRHPMQWHYDISFDAQGILAEGDIRVEANCGHSADLSSGIVDRALYHSTNAYAFADVRLIAEHRRLNQVSHTAFRGFGGPQGMLGIEAVMDEIAYHRNLDPLDVRLKNLYRPGANVTPYGQHVEGFYLPQLMQQLAQDCDYRQRKVAIQDFNSSNTQLKRGLALTPVQFGISFTTTHLNQAGAVVLIYRDGTVQVNHGGTEMGQGLHTKIRQVAADALGVPLDMIRHTATATDKVPNASATAASSGSDLNGMAVQNACQILQERLTGFAQAELGAPAALTFGQGRVFGGSDQSAFEMTFAELVEAAYLHRVSLSANGFYATPGLHFDKERGWGSPFYYYAYGAAASEVEIDTTTGSYRFLRTDILHDVGRSLNPAIDIGQIEGGFVQGLGWLTSEELKWNDEGILLSNSPANYKIPTADMLPAEFNVALFDQSNHVDTVYRSKAVGEPPFMLAISVWCALRQAAAACGSKLPSLPTPATPEAVYWAVQEAQS